MWYLRKVESSCKQFDLVSTCLCQKYVKFYFQNLGNGREDRNGRREIIIGSDNEKKISDIFF